MDILLLSIGQLLVGLVIVGTCVLVWSIVYSWFAANRVLNNTVPRSAVSWNTEHEFFDKITEFRNDFSRS